MFKKYNKGAIKKTEEGHKTKWPKDEKNKRVFNTAQKNNDRAIWNTLKLLSVVNIIWQGNVLTPACQIFHSNILIFQFTLKLHALLTSNNAGNVDAKDESNCSQAIRTRRLTTLLTGVMCATRTNTLILGQSLILTLKISFSKQNNHIFEESNQLLHDVVTWTAIIWLTDRLPAIGYIVHKSVPCAKMRLPCWHTVVFLIIFS